MGSLWGKVKKALVDAKQWHQGISMGTKDGAVLIRQDGIVWSIVEMQHRTVDNAPIITLISAPEVDCAHWKLDPMAMRVLARETMEQHKIVISL